MTLERGARLGPYEIVSPVGAGGMGEVWKARDTRLDRIVAVKMLKEEFSERFEREATAIAAFNHPSICQLYDVGPNYLVMEFVEGETIAEKLRSRPLKLTEALQIIQQVAGGLQAAHGNGIVHRDIKSSNVMVKQDGQAKLMDFGLALAIERSRLTQTGVAVGTPAYMSPEQARGDAADARSDIWGLGVVLYEMVTGQLPFARESEAASAHAILHQEPEPVTALRSGVPIEMDRIIGKALQKEPEYRYQHAEDFAVDVNALLRSLSSGTHAAGGRRTLRLAWVAATGWAVALIVALVSLWGIRHSGKSQFSDKVIRASFPSLPTDLWSLTPPSSLALSPDGQVLAYSAQRSGVSHLFLRRLDNQEPTLLAGTEGAYQPFFSPDGEWIGFNADGKLKKVSAKEGRVVVLADAFQLRGATWTADDWIYYTPSGSFSTGLWRVPASGGATAAVTKPDLARDETSHRWPQALPGGRSLLFTIWSTAGFPKSRLAVLNLRTGSYQEVMQEGAAYGQYVEPGYLLFARASELEAVPFDLSSGKATGRSKAIAGHLAVDYFSGYAPYAASRDRLIYRNGILQSWHLALVNRSGQVEDEAPMNAMVHQQIPVSISGRVAAVARAEGQLFNIWFYDVSRKTLSRATSGPGNKIAPLLSIDGGSIVFSSNHAGPMSLYRAAVGEPEKMEKLTHSATAPMATSWTPDGNGIVFDDVDPSNFRDIWLLDRKEGKANPLVRTPFDESSGNVSPDGRWLAFVSDKTGRREVFVQSFAAPGIATQVSNRGGTSPKWAKADSLVYLEGPRVMEARWTEKGIQGDPQQLLERTNLPALGSMTDSFAPTEDGRFLFLERRRGDAADSPAVLELIVNWTAAFR